MALEKIAVVGAGPGGLSAAVLLQSQGYHVEIYEAAPRVGGRNSSLRLGDFKFDCGPTFFLMPAVLEEIFSRTGRKLSDYLDLRPIEPLYRLDFADGKVLSVSGKPEVMAESIGQFSKKDQDRFWAFRERQRKKFEALYPAFKRPFPNWGEFLNPENILAAPFLDFNSVYGELKDYFESEYVRLAFTFQAKYLGMSPFDCPSLFTILPHIEHSLGVWHPIGGCQQLSLALERLFLELGGKIHLSTPVETVLTRGNKVRGVKVRGQEQTYDFVVMNADFAYGMESLFGDEERRRYKNHKLEALKYSCSTFMIYLGLDRELPLEHHGVYFSQNYRKNIRELCNHLALPSDPSFYLHNPSRTDPTLAPAGQSALYILVPVPNLDAPINWKKESGAYRDLVLQKIFERTGIDLRPHILQERVITPEDWRDEFKVYKGATFNLAHSFDQMLQFRPKNESDEFGNLYLVGGGTHPGSGLPTILQSGIIASDLIHKRARRNRFSPLHQGRNFLRALPS